MYVIKGIYVQPSGVLSRNKWQWKKSWTWKKRCCFFTVFIVGYNCLINNSCATLWPYCELVRNLLYPILSSTSFSGRQWQYIIKSIFIGNSTQTTHLPYQNTHACAVSKQVFSQLQLNTYLENYFQQEGMLVHIKVKLKYQRAFHWQPPPLPSLVTCCWSCETWDLLGLCARGTLSKPSFTNILLYKLCSKRLYIHTLLTMNLEILM